MTMMKYRIPRSGMDVMVGLNDALSTLSTFAKNPLFDPHVLPFIFQYLAKTIIACVMGTNIHIYDITTPPTLLISLTPLHSLKEMYILKHHCEPITCCCWSPDKSLLASAARDNTLCIWSLRTNQVTKRIVGLSLDVYLMAWSPDGSLLATMSKHDPLCIWKIKTGKLMHFLPNSLHQVHSLAWISNNRLIGSCEGVLRVWDITTNQMIQTFQQSNSLDLSYFIAWSMEKQLLAGVEYSDVQFVKIMNPQTGEIVNLLPVLFHVRGLAWEPYGALLIMYGKQHIIVWNTANGEKLTTFETSSKEQIESITWTTEALFVAFKNLSERVSKLIVRTWDVKHTGQFIDVFEQFFWLDGSAVYPL